jgi:phenylalanyl-tRNA synthetase beta subunit
VTILNLGTKTTLLSLSASDVVTATVNRTGVDLVDYEGDIMAILDAEAGGASITYAVKIQDSADNSTFADVSGLAFTTTDANTALQETLKINSNEVRRYIRAVITVAGGTGAGAVSVVALGSKKYG